MNKFINLFFGWMLFFSSSLFSDIGKTRFHNLSPYYLDVEYRLSGKTNWRHVFLRPEEKSKAYRSGKHGSGSADVRDMVVSIFRERDYKPVDIALWSPNIRIENNKTTDVYFKMFRDSKVEIDKRLDKKHLLGRRVVRDGKLREEYLEKFGADTKLRHFKILLHSLFKSSFKRENIKIDLEKWIIPNRRLRLDQVCLLASHNSFSCFQDGYRFYYQQYYDIIKQFNMGVRCFLLDCYPTKPGTNIDIKKSSRPVEARLCHGDCKLGPVLRLQGKLNYVNLVKALIAVKRQKRTDYVTMTLKESLEILKTLLFENRDEVLCIELENYIDMETTDKVIRDSGIDAITLRPEDWDILEKEGKWPTLDWMLKNNKRVVFWANNGPSKYVYNQWEIQRSNLYGVTSTVEGALKERSDSVKMFDKKIADLNKEIRDLNKRMLVSVGEKLLGDLAKKFQGLIEKRNRLNNFKYLGAINLFPGALLENAQKYILEATKKITIKDMTKWHIRAGLSELIKAFRNIKLYWGLNYRVVNGKILFKIVEQVMAKGLDETDSLKGQMPNFLNLDQVHEGNSLHLVNELNRISLRMIDNPNLKLQKEYKDFATAYLKKKDVVRPKDKAFDEDSFSKGLIVYNEAPKDIFVATYYHQGGKAKRAGGVIKIDAGKAESISRLKWKGMHFRKLFFSYIKDDLKDMISGRDSLNATKIGIGLGRGHNFYIEERNSILRGYNQLGWLGRRHLGGLDFFDKLKKKVSEKLARGPYKKKVAHVSFGSELSKEEKDFLVKRRKVGAEALSKVLNKNIEPQAVPVIACAHSGGGFRAMISSAGILSGLEKIGILDAVTYIAGISGSTWCFAPFVYYGKSAQEYKQFLADKVKKNIFKTPVDMMSIISNIFMKNMLGEHTNLIDIYGGILGNKFFGQTKKYKKEGIFLSDLAENTSKGLVPMPILTAISPGPPFLWFEYTPFYIGANIEDFYVPTWSFGRKFLNGESKNFAPEQKIGFFMGIWGSAFALRFVTMINGLLKKLPAKVKGFLEKVMAFSKFEKQRLWPAKIKNPVLGVKGSPLRNIKNIKLVDAGEGLDFPVPPLVRRDSSIIILYEANGRVSTYARSLLKVKKWAGENGLAFPELVVNEKDKTDVEIKAELKDKIKQNSVLIFEDLSDSKVPTIIYFALLKNPNFSSTFDPEKETKSLKGFCHTAKFKYTKKQFNLLSGVMEHAVVENKDKILGAIERKIDQLQAQVAS